MELTTGTAKVNALGGWDTRVASGSSVGTSVGGATVGSSVGGASVTGASVGASVAGCSVGASVTGTAGQPPHRSCALSS